MKHIRVRSLVGFVALAAISIMACVKFARVPDVTLSIGKVVPGIPIKDLSVDSEDVLQDREFAYAFEKMKFTATSDDPKKLEPILFPLVREAIRTQKEFDTVLPDDDIHRISLLLGQVIASDSGRARQDHEKDLAEATMISKPFEFKNDLANLNPEEQFKKCYDRKLANNQQLVGMCLEPSHYVVVAGSYSVSEDLSWGLSNVSDLHPEFYLGETLRVPAFNFHRDPNFEEVVKQKTKLTCVSCSIPVRDAKGNTYPLNITLYKSPINKRWWLHSAERTVSVQATQELWNVIN
jgi:hypothetical protein